MPPAKVGVDSRAAQLIGFPPKFMVPLTNPTYEMRTPRQKRGGPYGLKAKQSQQTLNYMRKWK